MIRRPIEPLAWSVAGLFVLLLSASTLVLASFLASALADDWPGPLRMAQLDGRATCLEIRSRAPEGAWARISGRPDAWFLPTATLDASHPAGAWATLQLRDGRWFCAPQLSVLDQGRPVALGFSELRDWMNSMAADRDRLRRQARDGQESSAQEYRRLAAAESSLRLRLDGTGQDVSFSDVATLHPPAASFTARLGIFLANLHSHLRSPSGFPAALVGTALTTLLAALLASPLGIAAAIWLSEFSRPGLFARLFRRSVQLLSGIPPVVFGAFGLVFLVRGIGSSLGGGLAAPSLLWASLTLGLLALPTVTRQAHLSLQRVPSHLREASLSCGASRLQTLLRVVLPASARGLLSAVLMGAVQALAETAPILLTGAVQLSGRAILDSTFPFFHPLGGFEHLGSHIFYGLEQLPPGPSGAGMESLACLILAGSAMGLRALAAELRHPRSLQ